MKKIFKILGVFVIIVIITFFLFFKTLTSDIRGLWTLTSPQDGCFTKLTFTDGPVKNRGISLEETNGNKKKEYIGIHEVDGQQLTVHVDNYDDIASFDMIYTLTDEILKLDYSWNNEDYSCTYEHIGS